LEEEEEEEDWYSLEQVPTSPHLVKNRPNRNPSFTQINYPEQDVYAPD
jgi:hypothetical protein